MLLLLINQKIRESHIVVVVVVVDGSVLLEKLEKKRNELELEFEELKMYLAPTQEKQGDQA